MINRKLPIQVTYKIPASVLVTAAGIRYLSESRRGEVTSDHIKTISQQRGISLSSVYGHVGTLKAQGIIRTPGERDWNQDCIGYFVSRKRLVSDKNDKYYGQSFIYDPEEFCSTGAKLSHVKAYIAKEQVRVVSCLIIGKKSQAERWAEMLSKGKPPRRLKNGEYQDIPMDEVQRTVNLFQNQDFFTKEQLNALQSGNLIFQSSVAAEHTWRNMTAHLMGCSTTVEKLKGTDTKGPIGPILEEYKKKGHFSKEEISLAFDKNDYEVEKLVKNNMSFFRGLVFRSWDGRNYSYVYEHAEGREEIIFGKKGKHKPLSDHLISDDEMYVVIHRFLKDLKNVSAGKTYKHKALSNKEPDRYEEHKKSSDLAWHRGERMAEGLQTEEALWDIFEEFKSIHSKRRPYKKAQELWNKDLSGTYEAVIDGTRYLVEVPVIGDKPALDSFLESFEKKEGFRKEKQSFKHSHTMRVTVAQKPLATSLGISEKTMTRRIKLMKDLGLVKVQRNELCLGDYAHGANTLYNSVREKTGGIAGHNKLTFRTQKHVRDNNIQDLGVFFNEAPGFLDTDPGGNKLKAVLSLPNTFEFVNEKTSDKPAPVPKMAQKGKYLMDRKINLCTKGETDTDGGTVIDWTWSAPGYKGDFTQEQKEEYAAYGEYLKGLREKRKNSPKTEKIYYKTEIFMPELTKIGPSQPERTHYVVSTMDAADLMELHTRILTAEKGKASQREVLELIWTTYQADDLREAIAGFQKYLWKNLKTNSISPETEVELREVIFGRSKPAEPVSENSNTMAAPVEPIAPGAKYYGEINQWKFFQFHLNLIKRINQDLGKDHVLDVFKVLQLFKSEYGGTNAIEIVEKFSTYIFHHYEATELGPELEEKLYQGFRAREEKELIS